MFKAKEIIEVCNGELLCGDENKIIHNFTKDSRDILESSMFLGIVGENFDGNDFFCDALKNGAIGCVINKDIDKPVIEEYKDKVIIKVEDTIKAIQKLAKYKREQYNIPVVAVTGSVGKTSTKDLIASVVSTKYNVLKTEGNMNNEIGLPLTLLKLENHNAVVIELGMNHFGEISKLTNIAKPTIAVINNIGTAHIGNLGSREGILKAKLEILEGLQENGVVVINNDNDLLSKWNNENKEYEVKTFGIQHESDLMAYNIKYSENGSEYNINVENSTYNVEVPVGGEHFVLNSLCAFCVGRILKISEKDILKGIKEFELTKMRMDIIRTTKDIIVINDAYNASYDSMKYILRYLSNLNNKRKIAVLGDMLELGEYARELHERVGEEFVKNNIDILITIGENSKHLANKVRELEDNKEIYECSSIDEIVIVLERLLKEQDTLLIKGSRGMELERILGRIENKIGDIVQ